MIRQSVSGLAMSARAIKRQQNCAERARWCKGAIRRGSGGSERELGVDMRLGVGLAVRTSRLAGLGAGPESLFNDGLDRAGAATTFDAATQAAVYLPGIAGKILRGLDRAADIVVADNVAGTDNHENGRPIGDAWAHRYSRPPRDAKGKTVFSSDSKLTADTG
jgi:hypothetical protein